MDICIICKTQLSKLDQVATLTQKGCDGILKASKARHSEIEAVPGQKVHIKCRSEHTNPKAIGCHNKRKLSGETEYKPKTRRSEESSFSYRDNCIFCGRPDTYNGKKPEHKLVPVRTMDFQEKVLQACEKYDSDWAAVVRGRVSFACDLPAADAVYHELCSTNFRTGKQVPRIFQSYNKGTKKLGGRPLDSKKSEAFEAIAEYLETNDDEQVTIGDLVDKMAEYLKETDIEPYGVHYMKEKLKEHFQDRIVVTEINGKRNVVTFRTTAARILHNFHEQTAKGEQDEKTCIIEAAAKFIQQDIKEIVQPKDAYPSAEDLSLGSAVQFLPTCLQHFLTMLFYGKDTTRKIASIGHAIMQAARPRVLLAPLQVGLGVQLHHLFQSKFLVDSLHDHGFCCSYTEVQKYERSASVAKGTEMPELCNNNFVQYSCDNVDHNLRTLDGKGTFHGMGIIAMVTPGAKSNRKIQRVNVTSEDIANIGRIDIHHFLSDRDALESMCYQPLEDPNIRDPSMKTDFLWKSSLLMKIKRPQWSGLMQMIYKGDHPGTSSVMYLPMIDMDPNDLSCIYSALKFISQHTRQHQSCPVITFDQPLWWKAFTLVESSPELQPAIIRLGAFHTEMSFLGSIGHLMSGSGIHELLEVVYASSAVGHMLTGKAVSRAVRGHILVNAALNTILTCSALGMELPLTSNNLQAIEHSTTQPSQLNSGDAEDDHPTQTPFDVDDIHVEDMSSQRATSDESNISAEDNLMSTLEDLLQGLLEGSLSPSDMENSQPVMKLQNKLAEEKNRLSSHRGARLWFQYMEMVDLLCQFIKAERLGNWTLHLQCLYDMVPYLAASGHNLYVKCVHLYLQKMLVLEEKHPEVYRHFKNGNHIVRRSDRLWGGISTDLAIEQCLMRNLKTRGGLTRGRGFTETQRLIWVLSAPACAEMNEAMQNFTGETFITSEQHKETSKARMEKDYQDVQSLIQYLAPRNPFSPTLRNIATGMAAHPSVNCDIAKEVGDQILNSMIGQKVAAYTFHKRNQAVTMSKEASVKIKDEVVHIDPMLLFQRLVIAGTRCGDLNEVFKHELCSYPPAMFESPLMMKEAHKASLADSIWSSEIEAAPKPQEQVLFVLDGGALLHRIPWTKGSTFEDILGMYTAYITHRYHRATAVFDGYLDSPSTKDCTHKRRSGGRLGAVVHFDPTMVLQTKKDEFLSNTKNKQRFINMLGFRLEAIGCQVHHAKGDADVLVVETAVACAEKNDTVVVADDTDILVLLIHHASQVRHNIWFKPNAKKKKGERCWNIAATRQSLGTTVCSNILFSHAFLGCDTTSRLHGIGKHKAVSKLKDEVFSKQAAVFMNPESKMEDIINAGNCAMVSVYNGDINEDLDSLRLRRFYEKTTSSTVAVAPWILPPSSGATKYHSLRVFHQVQVWLGNEKNVPPEKWGWKISDGSMIPMLTDKPPAPEELLKGIRCSCKTGCHSLRCTCRRNGLECSVACGECRGVCLNIQGLPPEEDDM